MWSRQSSKRSDARQPPKADGQQPQDHHTCQYRDDLDAANARIRRMEARMEEERTRYKQEIASLQHELSIAKNSAGPRGKEVTTTQADRLSIPEARATIDSLNEVLADAPWAAAMCSAITSHHYPDELKTAAVSSVTKFLGPNVPAMLIAESRRNTSQIKIDEGFVYTIVQLLLVHFSGPLVTSWCPGDLEQSHTLKAIYRGLRSTEDQSVFGCWRALAFGRIRISFTVWQRNILAAFEELLVVAGWKVASDADFKRFKQHLKVIFEAAIKTRMAVWEKVTSVDLMVTHIPSGALRKSNVAHESAEIVAGTFSFGLDKVTKTGSTTVFPAQVITEPAIREGLQRLVEPGAAHTANQKTGAVVMPTTYTDGVEQRAARNPAQG